MKRFLIIFIVFLSIISISAQSLLDNPDYKKSLEFQTKANEAYELGDYDAAYEYAQQAKEYASKSDAYVEKMIRAYKAAGDLRQVEDRMHYLSTLKAGEKYPEVIKEGTDLYDKAKELYEAEKYEESRDVSKQSYAVLFAIDVKTLTETSTSTTTITSTVVSNTEAEVKPKYYTVRLFSGQKESFWKIAGYDFVYGDSQYWTELYKLNKHKLQDPNNPDLIQPGVVIEIPSLHGEIREGYWKNK